MKSRLGMLLVGVAALACGSATASPIVTLNYYVSVPASSTNWSTAVPLQQFSHTLGTLQSVTVDLVGSVSGSLKVADTQTFNNVTGTATSATPSTSGFTTAAHTTHCTSASASCSVWNLSYVSSPPVAIPTTTIHSSLSADITLHFGANSLDVMPTVNKTNTLQAGPGSDPASFSFTKQYSGNVINKVTALAKTISSSGIVAPNVVPAAPGVVAPCNQVYGACVVGGHTYNTGVTYAGLLATAANSATYTAPSDLAFFYGHSVMWLPAEALGASSHDGGANVDFQSTAYADLAASIVYSYMPAPEPLTLSLFGAGLLLTGAARRKRT